MTNWLKETVPDFFFQISIMFSPNITTCLRFDSWVVHSFEKYYLKRLSSYQVNIVTKPFDVGDLSDQATCLSSPLGFVKIWNSEFSITSEVSGSSLIKASFSIFSKYEKGTKVRFNEFPSESFTSTLIRSSADVKIRQAVKIFIILIKLWLIEKKIGEPSKKKLHILRHCTN